MQKRNWLYNTFTRREDVVQSIQSAIQPKHPASCSQSKVMVPTDGYCLECGWVAAENMSQDGTYQVVQMLKDIIWALQSVDGSTLFGVMPKYGMDILSDAKFYGPTAQQAMLIRRLREPFYVRWIRSLIHS